MYESPIETIYGEIQNTFEKTFDEMVLKTVQHIGINVDKDELIKALKYDREQYEHGYQDGELDGYKERDAEIVRCKDEDGKVCKHYINHDKRCGLLNHGVPNEFFCKWGERRDCDNEG